ncbi:MAG: hypothetical protein AAFV93_23685 [Chloroflexota bacterium]
MPITVNWSDDTKRIMIWKYHATWTLEEFHDAIEQAGLLGSQITHFYVSIVDYSDTLTPAHKVLSAASTSRSNMSDNLVAIINVKPNMLFSLLMKAFNRFVPQHVQVVEEQSLDDAFIKAESLLTSAEMGERDAD